jgi:hypothetical protein
MTKNDTPTTLRHHTDCSMCGVPFYYDEIYSPKYRELTEAEKSLCPECLELSEEAVEAKKG